MKAAIVTVAVGTLLLPVVLIGAATGAVTGNLAASDGRSGPVDGIPAAYLQLYLAAGAAYGLPWELLAAIGKVECDHGQAPVPACTQHGAENHAGAGGPMQFLAGTWAMYGVDADHDGTTDRWNPADTIYSAARYLRASGAPRDIRGAVFAYNHSTAYVDDVLRWAARYRTQATTTAVVPGGDATGLATMLLRAPTIRLQPQAAADVRTGRVDPRLIQALLALGERHRLDQVGPFISGHARNVAGTTRPSNHAFGRAVDIPVIDGEPVSATSRAARAAGELATRLPAAVRPSEIGSPFPDLCPPANGCFTDQAHRNHLHLGYDQ